MTLDWREDERLLEHWKTRSRAKRSHYCSISLSPDEYNQLTATAEFFGVVYAEVLREALRMYAIQIANGGDT
jgi:hypothetical protein